MKHFFAASYHILSGSLRPWLPENKDDEKFSLLITKIRNHKDDHQTFFKELGKAYKSLKIEIEAEVLTEFKELQIILPDPDLTRIHTSIDQPSFFDKKTEFYSSLLKNEYFAIINGIYNSIKTLEDEDAKYKLYHFFKKIEELAALTTSISDQSSSTIFIINLLKLHLFSIHNELKRIFPDIIDFDVSSQNEILYQISPDFESEKDKSNSLAFYLNLYINSIESTKESTPPPPLKTQDKEEIPPKFVTIQKDFRPGYRGKLSYDDILKKQQFTRLEEHLYEYEFIDLDYNFKNKHERKKHLAAIIKILISKDYFKKKNMKSPRKEFDQANYRQYLDHRYNVNTSQQFSRIRAKDIEQVEFKYIWLNNV